MTNPTLSTFMNLNRPAYLVWAQMQRERVEKLLSQGLACAAIHPEAQALHEAMAYSVLGGGKRFRALLAYATAEGLGLNLRLVDAVAVAIELMHAYSLIHDDLPAMDNDVMRRGKPTCHVKFGEAMAILAGDALQALAFEVLLDAPVTEGVKLAQIRTLAVASGRLGMVGGQMLDMQFTGRGTDLDLAALTATHRAKTGALIAASVQMAMNAMTDLRLDVDVFRNYGERVGLLFQMVDDVLDVTATTDQLGKTQGKDVAQNKLTYPAVMGLEATQLAIQAQWQSIQTDLIELVEKRDCPPDAINLMGCLLAETFGF